MVPKVVHFKTLTPAVVAVLLYCFLYPDLVTGVEHMRIHYVARTGEANIQPSVSRCTFRLGVSLSGSALRVSLTR
jgi:hypothetical protein